MSAAAGEPSGRVDRLGGGAGLCLDVGDDRVAVLEFDQPGTDYNRLTPELLERFEDLIARVRSAADEGEVVGLVVASAKPDSFVAGVDVDAIARVPNAAAGTTAARQGQLAFEALAELPIRTVAAINGTCLGGATEMALACDVRIAADCAAVEIGLPEVNLGIIPGFGGTQRLPRLLSLERSLRMILTGKSVGASRARRYGLVDEVVPAPLLREQARRWARGEKGAKWQAGRRPAPEDRGWGRRLRRALLEGNPLGRALVFRQSRKRVLSRSGGHYPAPLEALEAVREGLGMTLDEGLRHEAERVGPLIVSPVAKSLLGIFFLRQAARRRGREGTAVRLPVVGDDEGAPAVTGEPVDKVGVLGAGVMGGGIAQLAAYNQRSVRLRDIEAEALDDALRTAHRRLEERRRAGRLTERDVRSHMGRISPTLEMTGFRHADLIIEAVVENLDVKLQVLSEVEEAGGNDTVIATNTSSLTLEEMSSGLSDPSRLVGLHFFNPVHKMQLVEVVQGELSSPQAVATAARFAVEVGKVPVVVKDAPGFFVNRVLMPYMNEALALCRQGVSISRIDGALEEFGMPMGPLRLLDEVGLDVAEHVGEVLARAFGERIPPAEGLKRLRKDDRLGRKGGLGFYRYDGGDPKPDSKAASLVRSGGGRSKADPDEIVDRCILAMLNEACWALAEEVVASPQDGDLALVLGTGFAPFRGGIFRYAQLRGLPEIRERLGGLAAQIGPRFDPAPQLVELVESGGSFYPDDWPATRP